MNRRTSETKFPDAKVRKFLDVCAWANRRSPTVWQSIANIFNLKKIIKIEGCYLFMVGVTSFILSYVHKLGQTLLGKVVNCVLKI